MLISLYIKNFGLIDEAEIEFGPGLNVFTGETGAGKSIVLEALRVALGGRAQTELIRTDRDHAFVQAIFDITQVLCGVSEQLELNGIALDEEEPGMLLLSREINRQGRNPCRINGRIVNLAAYRQVADLLVDIYGQHDQQSLQLADKQMEALDRYGGAQVLDLLQATGQAYGAWRKYCRLKEKIISHSRERQQRMDMIKYQIEEIDAVRLTDEDEEELIKRRDLLANAENIALLSGQALTILHSGSNRYTPAVDLLGEAQKKLDELCLYLPELKSARDNVYSALCLLEETAHDLASCRDSVESDPRELSYLEDRLVVIERLKKKYGQSIAEILAHRQQIAEELEELLGLETDAAGIEAQVEKSYLEYNALAQQLEALRIEAASRLKLALELELKDLAMSSVQFVVQVTSADPGLQGQNAVEFLISPNPGEPLRPLAKTASGGEMSRVMLALKSILASADEINTMVFDEVDSGIGGYTLQTVAEKLDQLSQNKQILCVTHAATVAAYAVKHYLVAKSVDSQRTVTSVMPLTNEELRVAELRRMLGGDHESQAILDHARDLLRDRLPNHNV